MSKHHPEAGPDRHNRRAVPPEKESQIRDRLVTHPERGTVNGKIALLKEAIKCISADLYSEDLLAEDDHFGAYEQLTAYLDGKLDEVERIIADSHLEICPACMYQMQELSKFYDKMSV